MKRLICTGLAIWLFVMFGCTTPGEPIAAPSAPFNKKTEQHLRTVIKEAFATPRPDKPGAKPLVLAEGELEEHGSFRDWTASIGAPESRFEDAMERRAGLIDRLDECSESSVRNVFERLMKDGSVTPHVRLVYAVIAARAGSERGAQAILKSMKNTDQRMVHSNMSAIKSAMGYHVIFPGETVTLVPWAIELACAMIRDDRLVTGIDESYQPDYHPRVSDIVDSDYGLTTALGEMKAPQAFEPLMERVRMTDADSESVSALGDLGDQRAVPLLLEYTRKYLENPECQRDRTMIRLLCAFSDMKATQAGPLLIEHMDKPFVIDILLELHESRAIPALRELIARDRGNGMARYALALLEPGDPVPRLCELLGDKTAEEVHGRVVDYFSAHPDRRAVAPLLLALKTHKNPHALWEIYQALSHYPFRETIDGLLDCLDLHHYEQEAQKRAPDPIKINMTVQLLTIFTGENFGEDKAQWEAWWKTHRESFKKLPP